MQFLDNMKVAAKVALSSGSILALLLLSAAISVWGLSTAKDNFSTYRSLARQTAAAGEAQAQLLTARIGVKRSEEHTSELQSLMRISYAVFCLKKKQIRETHATNHQIID